MVNYVKYKDQDYKAIKDSCIKNGALFEDPEFPASNSSLCFLKQPTVNAVWKRPKEINDDAAFFVDGASCADVTQGKLGNCWFVAAAASLSQHMDILDKVIPDHKSQIISPEKKEDYQGIFRFNFWRFGEWIEVVVDDRLPTVDGELIYTRSDHTHEFWSALLEKAYAKLAGCYEALEGGNPADALVDFTGGVSETIDLERKDYANDLDKRKLLHKRMARLMERSTLCSAAIKVANRDEMEKHLDVGLVKGHAYSITDVKTISLEEAFFSKMNAVNLYLVKLRNPWGQKEWNGPWSDGSQEWEQLGEEEREKLNIKVVDDGEFWMSWDDFCRHFTTVTICALVNTSVFTLQKTYNEGSFKGIWKGRSAGGCINNKATFLNNPQYIFDMAGNKKDVAFISLMQPDTRKKKAAGKGKNLTIGFFVMKVEANRNHRVHYIYDVVGESTFVNSREIFKGLELDPGRYVIIPSTFEPKKVGEFLIRVYTDECNNMEKLLHEKPNIRRPACLPIWKHPATQMTVIVMDVLNLVKKGSASVTVDPYCIIECEGTKVTTPTLTDNLNPHFNYGGVFFVKKPGSATLKIQVWDNNVLAPDTLLGGFATSVRVNKKLQLHTQSLMEISTDGKDNVKTDGTISFKLAVSNRLGFM